MKIFFYRCLFSFAFFALFLLGANAQVIDPTLPDPNPPHSYEHLGLYYAWGDEFNNTGVPNPDLWSFEQGFVRNQELQWYQPDNASVSDGRLLIEGRRETFPNPNYEAGSSDWRKNRPNVNYTSSCLITSMKKQFWKGRIEVRAKLDVRKGNWPAIWTLGQNKEWPSDGEIDMLEYYRIGGVPSILANFAWGTNTRWVAKWNGWSQPLTYFTAQDPDWADKYHVWRMDWDETTISLYLDDELLNTQVIDDARNGDGSVCFNQPQYMLLNLALGGNGGDPSSTEFPTSYEVDYFRVYQKTVDLEKPTVVTDITASNVSGNSCTLSWAPSTDNVGVVAYHLYNNGDNGGSYLGSTTTNSIEVSGLMPNSANSIIVRALDAVGNYSDLSEPLIVNTPLRLTGMVLSTGGTWGDNPNNTPPKVFDGNTTTFYDAKLPTGAWVGLDLGNEYQITDINFYPRSSHPARMTGGKFQASNTADFSSGVVDLHNISTEPPVTWEQAKISNTNYYRYIRYMSPTDGFCNVAEVGFYGTPAPYLTGDVLSYGGIWDNNPSNAPEKVFDLDVNTFYDANLADGAWVGLDLGANYQISKIIFSPRPGVEGKTRIVGGKFQASQSSDFSNPVDLHTVSAQLADQTWGEVTINEPSHYRYVRYLSPTSAFGNISEIYFFGDKEPATGVDEADAPQLSIYYDESSQKAHFKYNTTTTEPGSLTVINMGGQVMMKKYLKKIDGYALDLSSLTPGIYIVSVQNSSLNFSKKISKR